MEYWKSRSRFLMLSVALFAMAMPLDAFCVGQQCSDWPGYGILLFGWLPTSAANVTWLANPLLLIAWISLLVPVDGRRIGPGLVAIVALFVAASFMLFKEVATNEGGILMPITGYRAGYWLWLASMASCSCCALERPRKPSVSDAGL